MKHLVLPLMTLFLCAAQANPVDDMLERIDPGESKPFVTELRKDEGNFFELDNKGPCVVIRGNNWVNIALGLNRYLKYYAPIHLSWNGMTTHLLRPLPMALLPARELRSQRRGLHGRMDQLLHNFYSTRGNPLAKYLQGTGFTMEDMENNPIMFELMSKLTWRTDTITKEQWSSDWCFARYGIHNDAIHATRQILGKSIYNGPAGNKQQGTHESIFCFYTLEEPWTLKHNAYAAAPKGSSVDMARKIISLLDPGNE